MRLKNIETGATKNYRYFLDQQNRSPSLHEIEHVRDLLIHTPTT